MKYLFLIATISITVFAACNSNSSQKTDKDSVPAQQTAPIAATKTAIPAKDILAGYLQLKNALANDNGNDAATAGDAMVAAFGKFDKTALLPEQKKTYEDIEADAREHAEHIGKNATNIAHQREHFDILSKDMYELVKALGGGQTLYLDHCPMFNEGKGATWLSEVEEIKNPYFGKKMPDCGSVKEALK